MTPERRNLTRRGLVQGMGAAGLAAAAGLRVGPRPAGARSRFAAPMLQGGLSGEITIGYADELGVKPPYVEQAAEAVRGANPDATITIDLQKISGGDYTTQLLLALDSGEGPDVIHIGGDRIGELADAGYIAPLDDFLAEWEDWETEYPQSVRDGVTYDGSVWAVPYGLDTRFLYARRDILDQAGLGADWQPANLEGILEAAKAVKENVPNVLPYGLYAGQSGEGGTAAHGFLPIMLAHGGQIKDAEGKWIGSGPTIEQTLAYYERAWRTDAVVPTEILTTAKPWTAMREKIGTGELALLFEGGWVYGGYAAKAAEGAFDLEAIAYLLHPTVDAGPSFTIGGPGTVWYINEASENKELAWEFIKAFNTAEIVAALNLEDPHPVARADAAALPEFQENQYLVDATASLEQAVFLPPDPNLAKVIAVIQDATGSVAAGDATPEDAAARYREDLIRAVGEENVAAG
ncbi:MAG: hypothetical protein AVDCRST_MAG73-923 [uncultured Thermomicrobiales bacterium]|uniref:ABC transporter, substrate-binding protein (Cluster 1, maltose/g3p/polyamine/iron) n=1 Tax=uncultured Thermomicrobiales bacterium TaxID=1645740 RepID=A0A6J4TRS8_9BACT|nr:MAG: hypothetical protein AVDCRST_MAG73-923 [uncultured Thermomicrobiales bacterium]